jgi:hypothetical protein
MEDVTHWVVERVAKMPREHKFAIGDKLVEACLDVTCALVEATYIRDKLGLLAQASTTTPRRTATTTTGSGAPRRWFFLLARKLGVAPLPRTARA